MSRIIKHSGATGDEIVLYERETFALPVVASDEDGVAPVEVVDPEVERAEILAAARDEAEAKVREAYEEGYRRGEAKAIEEFEAKAANATTVFEEAAEGMRLARENFLEQLAPQVVAITRAVAERVALKECETDADLISRVAREALGQLASAQAVSIHIHPDDVEVVKAHKVELIESFTRIETVHIVADDTIERGGCQIDAETTVVDATLQAMIARALEPLDG